jgi:hypothetical protein
VGGTCGTHGGRGFGWRGQGQVADFCEYGDEPSGSIKKAVYFFDKLSDNQLFK